MMRLAALLLGLIFAIPALAQQGTVQQSGQVTPRHATMWTTNGIIQDAGTSANGALTTLGVTAAGSTPFCINNGVTTGPYSALCLGISPTSGATLTVQNFGGATPLGLNFNMNGNLSSFSIGANGVPNLGGPVSFNPLIVGTPPNNILTVTAGAASTNPITFTQSGTGGFQFNSGALFKDPAGSIGINRNVTLVQPTGSILNRPFNVLVNWFGTNLDPIGTAALQYSTEINNVYNAFNNGNFGTRGFGSISQVGPLSIGGVMNAITGAITQSAPFPPGTNVWAPNVTFAPNTGITNPNNFGSYYTLLGGTSASSGTGPSGQGQAITDGSIIWTYQGPGIAPYWTPTTPYAQGALVTNPNNGGLFRVEVAGTSGNSPGPVRPRAPWMAVRLASTGSNISLTGTPVIDSVQSVIGDRVLMKDETDNTTNGIYVVASGAWTRATDADSWPEIVSRFAPITSGTINGGNGFLCNVAFGGTIGTTPITFIASAPPNINAIIDGSVTWSLRGLGQSAQAFIGGLFQANVPFNSGGKNFNETVGTEWGGLITSLVNTNAQYVAASVGLEVDQQVNGSVRNATAEKIVNFGKQGQFIDIGLQLVALQGVAPDGTPIVGWRNAMAISSAVDPVAGYGLVFQALGQFKFQHMAGGLDMRLVMPDGTGGNFGGGFTIRGGNWLFDANGALQSRFGSITPTAAGLTIDVTNQELQTLAITPGQGGLNWSVGDGWTGNDGSAGAAATVDSNGQMLTASIRTPSQVSGSALPTSVILSPMNPETSLDALGNDPVPGTVGPTGNVLWPTPATATPTYAPPTLPQIQLGSTATDIITIGGSVAQNATAGFAHPFGLVSTGAPSGTPAITRAPACVINPTPSPAVIDCYIAGSWQHLTFTAGAG